MLLEQGQQLAGEIIEKLRPYCQKDKILVVGSIRRKKPLVNDIDIVLIPSDPWNLNWTISSLGQTQLRGSKIQRINYKGAQVDIYFATPETWATLLLIRTGSKESNQHLATIAKKMGWHLAASGDGLFNQHGERVAGDTEGSIFAALGQPYLPPEKRN